MVREVSALWDSSLGRELWDSSVVRALWDSSVVRALWDRSVVRALWDSSLGRALWDSSVVLYIYISGPFLLFQVAVKEAKGLPPSLSNFVFCEYQFFGQPKAVQVLPEVEHIVNEPGASIKYNNIDVRLPLGPCQNIILLPHRVKINCRGQWASRVVFS